MRPEVLLDAGAELGEGPVWDPRTARLVWVDILAGEVHSTDPVDGMDTTLATFDRPIAAAALRATGGLVLAVEDGFATLDDSCRIEPIAPVLEPGDGVRFNDGGVDPHGRFWAGTMAYDNTPGAGALYCLTADGGVTTALEGLTISNGVAFTPDGGTMYHVDTPTAGIDAFAVSASTVALTDRRRIVSIPGSAGSPDGMTIDADGCLWVALWGGAAVHRYTSDGDLDRAIALPVSQVTSCAFGGHQLDTLFVTTARHGLAPDRLAAEPLAGAVFALTPGPTGRPEPEFAG